MDTTQTARWGLLGRMTAQPGKRDELVAALLDSSREVPGKLVYLISLEQDDPDAFWITEVWRSRADYDACLHLPQVIEGQKALGPLIAGIEHRTETVPLGYDLAG
jgi:quinol monooxygenase YgiN